MFYKYLPKQQKYAIIDSSLRIVKRVDSADEATKFIKLQQLPKGARRQKGFGPNVPAFFRKAS